MKYREFIEIIEKQTGIKPSHVQVSKWLGGKPSANALSNRYFNDGNLKYEEMIILDKIIKSNDSHVIISNDNDLDDLVSIHYIQIPGIDNSIIKSPYVKQQLRYDREMVENVWQRKAENQRIVKMRGDKMNHGDYPLANNDILMIDISEINVANSGIYIYTTDLEQGREVYISNVNKRPNGDVRMSYLNPKYEEIIYTPEQLQEINFTVWGRVVKNLSLTI